jgi:phosphoribosylamine--glycine ligase
MIDADGTPNVLEFNCRFGDPETQPIMMRMKSDLPQLCLAALNGSLDQCRIEWDTRAAVGVVLAAEGYPEDYARGAVISGLDRVAGEDVKVFHAGTALDQQQQVVTNGGRVLCAVALGNTVAAAQKRAYEVVDSISWDGVFCRRDIAYRAIQRET